MTLFVNSEDNRKLYLAHPPRTGGRFLSHLLSGNGWIPHYDNFDIIYKNQELPHCDLSRYSKFIDVENVTILGIVRDPLERYVSALSIISHEPSELSRWKYSNLFTPQTSFFAARSHWWHFEQGFGPDLISWAEDTTKSSLPEIPTIPKTDFDLFPKIKATTEHLMFCQLFYFEDYERFGYRPLLQDH